MLVINDKAISKREKDANGFLIIKNNPIARAGVFDYLLSEIIPDAPKEKDRIVKVYRDFGELVKIKDNFSQKPIMQEHRLVGENGEATADGAIGSVIGDDGNEFLIADLIIYNPSLIEKIENGDLVELSPSYIGEISECKGRFNGIDYEYTQIIKSVNHLAVVEKGRSGKDLRIQDSNKKVDFFMKLKDLAKSLRLFADSCENVNNDNDLDRDEAIKEIIALSNKDVSEFENGENEKIDTISKLIEKLTLTKDTEEIVKDVSEVKDNENDVKDVSEVKDNDTEGEAELVSAIKELVKNEVETKVREFADSQAKLQTQINDSYAEVSNALGTQFNFNGMDSEGIYKFGYECLTQDSLPKGFDGKTAFRMALGNQNKTKKVSFSDSSDKVESDIINALRKMGRR